MSTTRILPPARRPPRLRGRRARRSRGRSRSDKKVAPRMRYAGRPLASEGRGFKVRKRLVSDHAFLVNHPACVRDDITRLNRVCKRTTLTLPPTTGQRPAGPTSRTASWPVARPANARWTKPLWIASSYSATTTAMRYASPAATGAPPIASRRPRRLLGTHSKGRAVDIACAGVDAYDILAEALVCGFTGIGVKQKGEHRFLHLDDLAYGEHTVPRPSIWSY